MREEHLEKAATLRKILLMGMEAYRRDRALKLLASGAITLSKAAQIARVTVWEMIDLARERRITWVDEDAIKEIRAVLKPR